MRCKDNAWSIASSNSCNLVPQVLKGASPATLTAAPSLTEDSLAIISLPNATRDVQIRLTEFD
jgi:hypothetical protein